MESEVFSVAIHYQKLTETELPTFIDMRIQQLREEGATEDIDLKSALFDYYRRHLTDGTFVSWLALDGTTIIGTSGMSFTHPNYRRQGIAKKLLSLVVAEAKAYGCGTVQITASDMGVLLYTDFGFQKNKNFMQLKLTD